jgi:hypothetical protein
VERQQHPDALKARARAVFERHGSRQAADQLGIPRRTVNHWARVEGWQRRLATAQPADQRFHPVAASAAGEAAKQPPAGRPRLAMRVRAELWALLDAVQAAREARRPRDAKDYAITAAIFLDKLLLLEQRDPGSGQLDPAMAVPRLMELVDVITERAAGDG